MRALRIAVFGKPGGGKSTLAAQIARITALPLVQLDLIQYKSGGGEIPRDEFLARHRELLAQDAWVLDGFGTPHTFEAMLRAADVLVYVERPPLVHYWWVTKRLLKAPFSKPVGWPANSPMITSTLSSYRYLRLSPRFWTPALKQRLIAMQPEKRVVVIRRERDVESLLNELMKTK